MTASRYELVVKLASGGMGTVYVGRALGAGGFWRLVAIKRAHPHLREDASLRSELVREGRLASRINHSNVVAVLDVEQADGELFLVMEYVEGASLSQLVKAANARDERLDPAVVLRILIDICAGLQAAHDACDERGEPLGIVHRDVSPHNVLVGVDGTAKLADFGVAKALRESATASFDVKGKLGYMAPEYLAGAVPTPRSDVYALGVVAWEAFASTPVSALAGSSRPALGSLDRALAPFDDMVARATHADPDQRFASAADFGRALSSISSPASAGDVAAALERLVGGEIAARRALVREVLSRNDEQTASFGAVPSSVREATHQPPPPATRPRRRARVLVALAGVSALGIAAFALQHVNRSAVEPRANDAPSSSPFVSATAQATSSDALDAAPAADAPPVATTANRAAVKVSPPHRPAGRGAAHAPRSAESVAPNPYRGGAAP